MNQTEVNPAHRKTADYLFEAIGSAHAKDQTFQAVTNYASFLQTWQTRIGMEKYLSDLVDKEAQKDAPKTEATRILS